jgi:DNA-binding PadR family transcriptional regulator
MTSSKASTWSTEFEKGHLKLLILLLLKQKQCHGYEIMNEIEERTLGLWRPTAGGIYPILKRMERNGLVKGTWKVRGKRRKIYNITPKGRETVKKILEKQKIIEDTMNQLHSDFLDISPSKTKPPLMELFSHGLNRTMSSKKKVEHLRFTKANLEEMIKKMQTILERVNRKLSDFDKEHGSKPERKTKNF